MTDGTGSVLKQLERNIDSELHELKNFDHTPGFQIIDTEYRTLNDTEQSRANTHDRALYRAGVVEWMEYATCCCSRSKKSSVSR
ncbi:hypothetical protein GOC83_18805 [Haloarcula rubripromontorii]|uniref:Uncharacterized protein n=1 Tax=Haloarcula rubripromontorii TaxID=1705562 RepID=A0A847U792_9EURY|nr:hypothetical protein [Haloarcula rubripromontorii]NLV08177.1 hypothetical protein [Haloarcula rubripromontorii]